MLNYSLLHRFIRNKLFRITKGRTFLKCGSYFLKVYDLPEEARYEYMVLRKIRRANPATFSVPNALGLIEKQKYTILVMEFVKGRELQDYIDRFILFKDRSVLWIFNSLGAALKELHNLGIDGLRDADFPMSGSEIREEIKKLSEKVVSFRVLSADYISTLNSFNLDRKLFESANLFVECYYPHIMVSNRKLVFLDFHEACRGPVFYDLAAFNVSLYGSLLLPTRSITHLKPLIETFLDGYFKREIPFESLKVTELYVILYTLNNLMPDSHTLKNRFITSLKTEKLRKIVEALFSNE